MSAPLLSDFRSCHTSSDSLASFPYCKDPGVHFGPTRKSKINSHLGILNFFTSVQSLLSNEATYSQVLGIRMWTPLEGAVILPTILNQRFFFFWLLGLLSPLAISRAKGILFQLVVQAFLPPSLVGHQRLTVC